MYVSNLRFVSAEVAIRRINILSRSFSVVYPHTGKMIFAALMAGATLAAGAAALVYRGSRREHTTPPREETAYDPQSSELVTGF